MKHTKQEILNALHVIKDTCYESRLQVVDGVSPCHHCPFSNCGGHCTFNEQFPLSWVIKDDEPWRAFE